MASSSSGKSDPFPLEKWVSRRDRSREPQWDHSDLSSMFGMTEIEAGVARVMNKARADRCLLADVHFDLSDLKDDADEMLGHGWLVASNDRYKLNPEAVRRVHRRYPNV